MKTFWVVSVGTMMIATAGLSIITREARTAGAKQPEAARPSIQAARQPEHEAVKPARPLREADPSGRMYLPEHCDNLKGPLDVVFHFHGVPHIVAEAAEKAGLTVVVRVSNEGEVSESYSRAWSAPGSFERSSTASARTVFGSAARKASRANGR